MKTLRQEKVSSVIRRAAGEFTKLIPKNGALITPIRADVSKDLKNATIFVTVFPEDKELEIMNILRKKRSDFRDFFKTQVKIKTTPFFDFKVDVGEKHRQRIDELSTK